jgi:hypothetical protein
MGSITRSFSYNPEEHPDIHRWMQRIPDERGALSAAIRRAIRADNESRSTQTGVTLDDVNRKLDRILAAMSNGVSVDPETAKNTEDDDLPPDILDTLKGLGG